MTDIINHPPHYKTDKGMEAIDVIESFDLGFHLGNVFKYLARAGRKGDAITDLRKARWYLDRDLARRQESTFLAIEDAALLSNYHLCYLATPYTKYHLGIEAAYVHASEITAQLMTSGVAVYSPIAHTHSLAVYGHLDPLDHSIWLPFDQRQMDVADCLIVARMKGWDESFGIKHEIEEFRKEGKPIYHLDPVTLKIIRGEME